MARRKRGKGTIAKISGNREDPWLAKAFLYSYKESGKTKSVYKSLGYYHTREDAEKALDKYNNAQIAGKNNLKIGKIDLQTIKRQLNLDNSGLAYLSNILIPYLNAGETAMILAKNVQDLHVMLLEERRRLDNLLNATDAILKRLNGEN